MFHSTLVTPCLSLLALFSIHVTVHSQPGQINCPSSNHPCASVAIGSMCDCNCDCSGTNSICDNSNPNDKKCAVGSGAVGSSSGSCNGEHAGCTDDQNCCSALICNSGKKCAVQSSSTINKCTGYNCADSSALKSGANDIDRGSNPQGNCCFDPKCSNNPGNSPIDYDCSQHGNKQLRSDAQNIQRFGGSGEQTNCCEATGTPSGGQNPAPNHAQGTPEGQQQHCQDNKDHINTAFSL